MRASGPQGTRDLFLSHSSANKPLVRKIASDVQAHERADGARLTVWLDEAEIRPGQSIPGAVNRGLEVSRFYALLMGPGYFASSSGWTDAEWHARSVRILGRARPCTWARMRHGKIGLWLPTSPLCGSCS